VSRGRTEREGRPARTNGPGDLSRAGRVRAFATVTLGARLDLGETEVHHVGVEVWAHACTFSL